jgi:hypothetical protein
MLRQLPTFGLARQSELRSFHPVGTTARKSDSFLLPRSQWSKQGKILWNRPR